MKYEVGDKVKIREDLEVGETYGADKFAIGMEYYKGKTAIITDRYDNIYRVNIDNDDIGWNWTDEMFEDTDKHISKFNIGDKVRLRRDLKVGERYSGLTLFDNMYQECCDKVMTIKGETDNNYMCKENYYWWGEDMLEKVEKTEENVGMTVEDLLNKTDVEEGGLIISIYYSNAYFEATIGHNKINRHSELYKRFIKAYGDMIVDEVSFDIRNDNMVVMLIKVDYAD